MSQKSFSHLNSKDEPTMVDVGAKMTTKRVAVARALIQLEPEVLDELEAKGMQNKKGPIFQTAILAGIMAAKKTSDLIPLCHPLSLDNCSLDIEINSNREIEVRCTASIDAKTGVEMEALTGASVAALTIYDMCKAKTQNILIKEVRLISKSGGKSDYVHTP